MTTNGSVLSRRDASLPGSISAGSLSNVTWLGNIDEPWRTGNVSNTSYATIDAQLFRSGIATLGGGDIVVKSGANISDLFAIATDSMVTANATPATGAATRVLMTFGSGNVSLSAGADILGGRVDVASGEANVIAGRDIASAGMISALAVGGNKSSFNNLLTLRISDATANISAGGDIAMQGVASLGPVDFATGTSTAANNALNARGLYSERSALNVVSDGSITVANFDDSLLTSSNAANQFDQECRLPPAPSLRRHSRAT